MKKSLIFLLLLSGCCRQGCKETAFIESEGQLMAMAGDSLPVKNRLPELTKQDRERLDRHYPSTLEKIDEGNPLSVQDIKNLTRAGVADNVIVHEIHATRSIFYLTPEDENELQQAGVSKRVINEMKETVGTRY